MTGRALRAIVIAALAAVLVSCGVPRSTEPQAVPEERVPYGLLAPSPVAPPSPTTQEPQVALTVPQVYYVESEELKPVPVPLEASGAEVVVRLLLERLAAGPAETERANGLDSALGFGLGLGLASLADGVATIELVGAIEPPSADRLPLAVGQIVLTATSVEGVDAVVLLRDGAPVNVPLPGGEQVVGPVTATPYLRLLAPSAARTKAPPNPTSGTPEPAASNA